jgi:hypothetical protein
MSPRKKGEDARKRQAYEHVLRSIQSAYEVLIECCHEIDDIDLDAARNTRDINGILRWVHETSSEIYRAVPELAPPPSEMPARRWPVDPTKAAREEYSREDALYRLRHNLELVRLILRESGPFAGELDVDRLGLDAHLAKLNEVHAAVIQEIWKDRTDEQKRSWIRDWGMPDGVPEPPPPDRHEALERLNQKLEAAAKLLNDCAELVVELELGPRSHLRTVGTCLGTVFQIQHHIYDERPDLAPGFLKGALELKRKESQNEPGAGT